MNDTSSPTSTRHRWPRRMLFLPPALLVFAACAGPSDDPSVAAEPATLAVRVVRGERGDVSRSITLPATVEAFETAPLHAKVSGYVNEVSVDIGDRVTRDQVLAVLDVPEMMGEYAGAEAHLAEARAQHAKAESDLALQKLAVERNRGLRKRGAVTQQDLDEAEAKNLSARASVGLARAQVNSALAQLERVRSMMDYAEIKAPFDGVVVARRADPGALMQAATNNAGLVPILVVARIDHVRVVSDIPEREVPYVDLSDHATFAPRALNGTELSGQLTRFAPALAPSTGTMRVEIDFPNPEGRIYPGMYGMLTLELDTHHNAVTLPSSAVVTDKKGNAHVYVVEDGVARRRPVRSGVDDGVRVEIVEGTDGTEQCIDNPPASVSDGISVRIVEDVPGTGSPS